MKTSGMRLWAATILAVVGCVGLGMAQAGGNSLDLHAWTVQDQEAAAQYTDYLAGPIETGNMPESAQVAPSRQESDSAGSVSAADWQTMGPVETGKLPDGSEVNDLDHTNVPLEGNIHQYWGADSPSN